MRSDRDRPVAHNLGQAAARPQYHGVTGTHTAGSVARLHRHPPPAAAARRAPRVGNRGPLATRQGPLRARWGELPLE